MIHHTDGSFTYTPEEMRSISVAYADLYAVIMDMPTCIEEFVGEYAALNIYKAQYLINGDEWPGVHAYLRGEYGDEDTDYPPVYRRLLDVDEETAERMLTNEVDDFEDVG